jgi:hypothetical protein
MREVSETLSGWKAGKTTYSMSPYGTEWRERGLDSVHVVPPHHITEREKPLMSLYETEWRELGYGLWANDKLKIKPVTGQY